MSESSVGALNMATSNETQRGSMVGVILPDTSVAALRKLALIHGGTVDTEILGAGQHMLDEVTQGRVTRAEVMAASVLINQAQHEYSVPLSDDIIDAAAKQGFMFRGKPCVEPLLYAGVADHILACAKPGFSDSVLAAGAATTAWGDRQLTQLSQPQPDELYPY